MYPPVSICSLGGHLPESLSPAAASPPCRIDPAEDNQGRQLKSADVRKFGKIVAFGKKDPDANLPHD
jgi:hypothetical protein